MEVRAWKAWNVDQRLGEKVLAILGKYYGVRVEADSEVTAIVQGPASTAHRYYFLSDNGGEFNVTEVNKIGSTVSIPYTNFDKGLSPATAAYRIAQHWLGEQIDYNYEVPTDIAETMEKEAGY